MVPPDNLILHHHGGPSSGSQSSPEMCSLAAQGARPNLPPPSAFVHQDLSVSSSDQFVGHMRRWRVERLPSVPGRAGDAQERTLHSTARTSARSSRERAAAMLELARLGRLGSEAADAPSPGEDETLAIAWSAVATGVGTT